jgi:hypothetical protein
MPLASISYVGNGVTTAYNIPFGSLAAGHIKATLDDVVTSAFTVNAARTTLTFSVAPAVDVAIEIYRETPQASGDFSVDFSDGSVLKADDIDLGFKHSLYLTQEILDRTLKTASAMEQDWDARSRKIKNLLAGVDPSDAITKAQLDAVAIEIPDGQLDALASQGIEIANGTFKPEVLLAARGKWTSGTAQAVVPDYAGYYEINAAGGDYLNSFVPQKLSGALGFVPALKKYADEGIFVPKGWMVGAILDIYCPFEIKADNLTGGSRNFYFYLDFNSNVNSHVQPYGSPQAAIFQFVVAQNSYPALTQGMLHVQGISLDQTTTQWIARLEVPNNAAPASPDRRVVTDLVTDWNWDAPTVNAEHTDRLGNTMICPRFGVSGAQDRTARWDMYGCIAILRRPQLR